jgi:quercetin dioxygenase-like cupin family protein
VSHDVAAFAIELSRVHRLLARYASTTMLAASLTLCPAIASAVDRAPDAAVAELMTKDLIGVSGKEILMITVEYLAGGASLPHRHDAQVFVYVLEGELKMQVKGGRLMTLRPGQTFYEGPGDVHLVSANASQTAPAKILVFMVKDKTKPASRLVPTAAP